MLNKAFLCIGPMSMPVAIGILLLLVAATCLRRVPSSKVLAVDKLRLDPETLQVEIPQAISSPVPYFGHVLGFVRGGHGYFSSLCARTFLPIFTIQMAKVKVSIVKPELTRDLPKIRHVSLNPLVLQLFHRSLDLGESSCLLLKEEDERSRKFAPEISRLFREEFIPNRKLRKYVEETDGYVQQEIMAIENENTIFLEDWIFKTLVGALGKSLWGGDSGPFGDPEFLTHLRTFLMNVKYLNAPFDFMIDNKLLRSRRFVRERLGQFSFEVFAEKSAEGRASTESAEESFLGRVRALCLAHGAAAEGWTDYQLLLIAGLGPNVMAASTWMFHHLLAEPELMAKVRTELDEFVKASEGSIDVSEMSEACPLLLATWYEVLRFHGGFSLGRYVHEDTVLSSKYLLQRGSYVLAPLRPHHFDSKSWGASAKEFLPGRFLREDGSLDEIQRRKLRVYGVFGTLCPGRYLAVNMAMVLIVRLLLAFDMTPLNGLHTLPHESRDTVAGLATPAFDAEVVTRRRINAPDGVRIGFKSNRQTF